MSKSLNTTVVMSKSDSRGDNWAYEASQRMHAKQAAQADRSAQRKSDRLKARAEKRATKQGEAA